MKVTSRGQKVWVGIVEVFDLVAHPFATRCYAWSHEIEGTDQRGFVAVLQAGRINSPRNAVRVAILQEFRDSVESAED